MARPISRFKSRFIVTLFIFSCVLFIGTGLWASAHIFKPSVILPQEINLHVVNRTEALRIDGIEKIEGQYPDVKITLTNSSSKNIAAYSLSIADLTMTTDYAALGSFLAPGQTKVEIIPFNNFEARATGELVVSLVYFTDKTGEGDPRRIADIREKYKGIREQLLRILPALKGQLNSPMADSDTALEALDAQASQLPTEIDNVKLSHDYRSGLDYIKQSFGINLKTLKNKKKSMPGFDQKAELRKLIALYERVLTGL